MELADPDFINLGQETRRYGRQISASTHLTESAFKAPGGMILRASAPATKMRSAIP
ncbi:MAG: hypothetical protein H6874_01850 [Hyphomicrobiaceae bacterium]|nr:hypothetical protein [Hyphomicrobiaceae bacterium]